MIGETKNYPKIEEGMATSVETCRNLASATRSLYGPKTAKRIVTTTLDSFHSPRHASTVFKQLTVTHPPAISLIMASKIAEKELGDGTNFVIQFASELMIGAAELLTLGVPSLDIIDSYNSILNKAIDILSAKVCHEILDLGDVEKITPVFKTAISTKEDMYPDYINDMIIQACISSRSSLSSNLGINNNIHILKIVGSDRLFVDIIQGIAVNATCKGIVSEVYNAKIAVLNSDFGLNNAIISGTFLKISGSQMPNLPTANNKSIKNSLEYLHEFECNVIILSGQLVPEILEYSNRFNIMVVQISSKAELQMVCRATSSTSIPLSNKPKVEQLGKSKYVYVKKIAGSYTFVISPESEENPPSTIIIGGSSEMIRDEIERSVKDGLNCYRSLIADPKVLPGAGAIEMALCVELEKPSLNFVGNEKLVLTKFTEALRSMIRIIAVNNGMKAYRVLSDLYTQHLNGAITTGLDVSSSFSTCDAVKRGILEPFFVKKRSLQLSLCPVVALLSIDQIEGISPVHGMAPSFPSTSDED